MSRVDPNDIESTARFNSAEYRRSGDREMEIAALMSLRNDRGGSQSMAGRYSALTSPQIHALGQNEREYASGVDSTLRPNRSNLTLSNIYSISPLNHHHHLYRSPPSPHSHSPTHDQGTFYQSSPIPDRDNSSRQTQSAGPIFLPNSATNLSRSTLIWGNFEPWMDEEYAKQVCGLMGWDPVSVRIPQPAPDPNSGQQANNTGYCFLTFPTPAHAASVLAQINNGKDGSMIMPNSSKPFALGWAPVGPSPSLTIHPPTTPPAYTGNPQQYQKEYSIFVGDLAPETSNSDLVAVFRNPVLGLRNDREPKFIRPFLSCKSAKIMLDPVTGVSRGYGFVRFTDEADQQRALIEMHGLYCLSRPMRISPATAKFKPPPPLPGDFNHGSFSPVESQPVTVALPLPTNTQTKSVSAPIAAVNSNGSLGSSSVQGSSSSNSLGGSSSGASLSSNPTSSNGFSGKDATGAGFGNGSGIPNLPNEAQLRQALGQTDGYIINEESWKHHAQARAILSNLIGPNGEQLTSTDPYNTTVFVGGLSPLISEETLRTFFAPFGDIHYVKVPVGKHCGFVQFVRKADAERAIEKMQGFPIGGSRIRLSWGRSQYKAAQAAAQAAQSAALQSYYSTPTPPTNNSMSQDQAISLLHKLSQQGYVLPIPGTANEMSPINANNIDPFAVNVTPSLGPRPGSDAPQGGDTYDSGQLSRPDIHRMLSNFSPFSPDPNIFDEGMKARETSSYARSEALPHPSQAYAPGFYPHQLVAHDLRSPNGTPTIGKISPSGRPPSTTTRYGNHFDLSDRTLGRSEPVSRPSSGHTSVSVRRANRDDLEDLNGTLASLDLDRPRLWGQPSPDLSSSYHKPSSPN